MNFKRYKQALLSDFNYSERNTYFYGVLCISMQCNAIFDELLLNSCSICHRIVDVCSVLVLVLANFTQKDTLCSLQWGKASPGTALSGLQETCPPLRSFPPLHLKRCAPYSGTSAHFEWQRCGCTAGSSVEAKHAKNKDDQWMIGLYEEVATVRGEWQEASQ